ncbi:uncharacterized protein NEMAJ01_2178 [Nematocida major]|uniref:uncharacterized protein n=1 Tax=Nematocida major TaxID=1912982 RepID=UPI002007B116|nr:uncharacterized protein NEMAJ01_2178 [Nematocida major]KAH9387282.1 hypothetical protein NEMAJ01_2178 [Nematocida major]
MPAQKNQNEPSTSEYFLLKNMKSEESETPTPIYVPENAPYQNKPYCETTVSIEPVEKRGCCYRTCSMLGFIASKVGIFIAALFVVLVVAVASLLLAHYLALYTMDFNILENFFAWIEKTFPSLQGKLIHLVKEPKP